MAKTYRDRFYEKYASHVHARAEPVPDAEIRAKGRVYDHWLRGWMPRSKDAAIVDLGCGVGWVLRYFADRDYKNVTGVDISEGQVALARQIHPNVVCANILEWIGRQKNAFDLITAVDVVEHLTRDEILTFFDDCFAALRPGGRILLQTPNGESPLRGYIWHGDFTHEYCFTAQTMRQTLAVCGFVDFEARETAPAPVSLSNMARGVLWTALRWKLMAANIIETGFAGSGVFTRVFLGSAVKPA